MPSSYTTSLRLELPVTGDLTGAWGTRVNEGITKLVDASIAGTVAVTVSDADPGATLTVVDGEVDQSRNMFITLSGTLTATRNVICPALSKLYFVTNSTTGGQSIVFKTSSGSGVTVPSEARTAVYCNGTNVVDAVTYLNAVDVANLDLNGPQQQTVVAVSALEVNCALGNYFTKTITSNSTFTFANAPANRAFAFTLELTHTSGTVTWPASVKWPNDTAPTLDNGKTSLLVFVTDNGGTRWRGGALPNYTT
jgi:hypothetical protein